jgi:hypothetical protein
MCGKEWKERADFLSDPAIQVTGYSAHFKDLELGLFYFNHETCKTTLALLASSFTDLYKGPVFKKKKTGSDVCPGHCLKRSVTRPCPVECECAYVREVLDMVSHWDKSTS